MLHVIILASMLGAPCTPVLKDDTATKLAAAIVKTNPRAEPYSLRLAKAIVREAKRHRIPVDILAAVGWAESWFKLRLFGKDGEVGAWQLVPRLDYHRESWYEYQQSVFGKTGFPSVDWEKLTKLQRAMALTDIKIGTYMAAHLLAYHLRRCGRPSPLCAARYNSGNAKVRPGYRNALKRYSRRIRRAMFNKGRIMHHGRPR